ncbi:MAG: hypothetical protein HC800_09870 [Phormidesmis sp. RL_2_1]|nr:hypothetical protein [Phormidesmis sp. RL_2_1]
MATDGSGVIMINEATRSQATQLHQKVCELVPRLAALTPASLKAILTYAREALNLSDIYNSTRTYVSEKLLPVSDSVSDSGREQGQNFADKAYGLMQRNQQIVCQAMYAPGQFLLTSEAETAQVFQQGGVIVEQQGSIRGIQPDVFLRTYQLANGQPIHRVEDLALYSP